MENEEVIREQMDDTRASLSEKLELLEQKVADTVEAASSNVTETVEAVKETVQETVANMKDTVQNTISAVKDSVKEGVSAVQGVFDIKSHFEEYPWPMMAGSLAVGYMLGGFLIRKQQVQPTEKPAVPSKTFSGSGRPHKNGRDKRETKEGGILQSLTPELNKLKGLALGTLMGTLREMVMPAVPPNLSESVGEIFDSVTNKLGGTVPEHGNPTGGPAGDEAKDSPMPHEPRWAQTN